MIMSGSDDGLLKIWDVRALGISNKPVGIFYGHFAGITYVDTRNDGVYICSNSKD
jgi:WD repeat-containing protein 23